MRTVGEGEAPWQGEFDGYHISFMRRTKIPMIISTIQEFIPRYIYSSLGEVMQNGCSVYTLVVSLERIYSLYLWFIYSWESTNLSLSLSGLAGSTLN